jgi:hypothetical protein
MPNRGLIAVIPILITACSTDIKPDQIARVERNFGRIKPGMTGKQVEALVGKPYKEGGIGYTVKTPSCKTPPCQWDVWALNARIPEDYSNWPIVIFEPKTGRVSKVSKDDFEDYFPF